MPHAFMPALASGLFRPADTPAGIGAAAVVVPACECVVRWADDALTPSDGDVLVLAAVLEPESDTVDAGEDAGLDGGGLDGLQLTVQLLLPLDGGGVGEVDGVVGILQPLARIARPSAVRFMPGYVMTCLDPLWV